MVKVRRSALRLRPLLTLLLAAAAVLPLLGPGAARAQVAGGRRLSLRVESARSEPRAFGGAGVNAGALITQYQFIINRDNVGDVSDPASECFPDAGGSFGGSNYPANCDWPSIKAQQGHAPVIAQGDQADIAAGLDLPPGNYLISVMADGYKLDGQWFSVPFTTAAPVVVRMQPHPLPTATLRAKVFADVAPTNGAPDVPLEQGLAGFRAIIGDQIGEITVDMFGNPLCTTYVPDPARPGDYLYDAEGLPIVDQIGGGCYSDANGDLVVPNVGPNRYEFAVSPPAGQGWIQTTTLEGRVGWDTWAQEGYNGLDNEFQVAGEPFPWTMFGFVKAKNELGAGATGVISGRIRRVNVAVPYSGGLPYSGSKWGGLGGAKDMGPIEDAWVSLNSFDRNDSAVYTQKLGPDGVINIPGVPDGTYLLTYWDEQLLNILDWVQVTVANGQVTDIGDIFLTGWFSQLEGRVFIDTNANGKFDAGEAPLAGFPIAVKRRTNSTIDRQAVGAVTGPDGSYKMENVYPLTNWIVIEAYNDRFYTTGYTFQAWNQPSETTILGDGVDVNYLPLIGQSGRLDFGVLPYDAAGRSGRPRNGGIVGTVSYDTTRNELDARFAGIEPFQPGIPGMTVNLYAPVPCDPELDGPMCVPSPGGVGAYMSEPDGSLKKGVLLGTQENEQWARPTDCTIRDVDGAVVDPVAIPSPGPGVECLEGPQVGTQFGKEFAAVDGNWGFTEIAVDPVTGLDLPEPIALPAGDYLVEVVSPKDARGEPIYQVTREEDINVFDGDQWTPQIPPPPCAGAMHTVDVEGVGADGPDAVANPAFAEAGGSPYEGQQRPLCDVKLVTVSNGRSVAPGFTFFTEVPLPGRWFGYIINDLVISMNPRELFFGEKQGIANSPIGIYDFTNRLVKTISSDRNGVFEALLPSDQTINCPTPSGICTNNYHIIGNDPGTPGALNPNYNPSLRTIGATFEIFPGDITIADLAPTNIGVSIQAPGSQFATPVQCLLETNVPQIFAVDKPYVLGAGRLTIRGIGFGAAQGSVALGGTPLGVASWTARQIAVDIPAGFARGAHQLTISTAAGRTTVNGLSVHVLGPGYNPRVYEVGPARAYASIQQAIDATGGRPNSLVVVYPGGVPDSTNPAYNPQLAYFENLIISRPLRLQGVGPGGVYPNGAVVEGSVIDGSAYGGDTPLANAWRARLAALAAGRGWDGDQAIGEGATVTLLGRAADFGPSSRTLIDGFSIQGGNQQNFPNTITQIGGLPTGEAAVAEVQGGGVFANAGISNLQVSNNILQSNGGAYGGAIRMGTPHLPGALNDNQNDGFKLLYNRVLHNGGTNLAGGVALFSGAEGYEVAYNDICGNYSAEYGGGISHYGYSPGGSIHHNRIYFNQSYDEAGGVMIAGELPADPATLTRGAGPVDVYNNLIQANLGNDDGGGLRLLMAGNYRYNIYNNIIVNNVSTHEGGGVSLNDAPDVRFYNNTVMKNITTATAMTSNGQAAPAGLSTAKNSALLQATLPAGAPLFSNPVLFNNVFADNRAGSWDLNIGGVAGIGQPGDPNPINRWDMGVADLPGALLAPRASLLQTATGTDGHGTNLVNPTLDPLTVVVATYEVGVQVMPWRGNPRAISPAIVAVEAPPSQLGNYHLRAGSPARELGLPAWGGQLAPAFDYDDATRPTGRAYDAGADETNGVDSSIRFLDQFVQANGPLSSRWIGDTAAFTVLNNQLRALRSGYAVWRPAFGANQEALISTQNTVLAGNEGVLLKANGFNGATPAAGASAVRVTWNRGARTVTVATTVNGTSWTAHQSFGNVNFSSTDVLRAMAMEDGWVYVYKNSALIGAVDVVAGGFPAGLAAGAGNVGIWYDGPGNGARFSRFGGGTLP